MRPIQVYFNASLHDFSFEPKIFMFLSKEHEYIIKTILTAFLIALSYTSINKIDLWNQY